MIFIITGGINTGKTTRMLELFMEHPLGDGFVCPKNCEENKLCRYDIRHLQTGQTIPFAYPSDTIPENWVEQIRYGKYTFSVQAFNFAKAIANTCLENHISPFFLDEIGPIELDLHQGFYSILKKIKILDIDFYISVRKCRIHDLANYFDLKKTNIIHL